MRTKVIDQRRRAGYFPYYKLQVLAPHVGAWKDVQRRFKMAEAVLEHDPKPSRVGFQAAQPSGR